MKMNLKWLYFCILAVSCLDFGDSHPYQIIDLSGSWDVLLDRDDQVENGLLYLKPFADKISLPGTLSKGGYGTFQGREEAYSGHLVNEYKYVGKAWYKKDVHLAPDSSTDYLLFLERCHWETSVWLNGHPIGTKNSLSIPHIYNISGFLKKGSNQLIIRVDNSIKLRVGGWAHSVTDESQTNWNGIIGRMEIQEWPKTRLAEMKIIYDDADRLAVKGRLAGNFADVSRVNIVITRRDGTRGILFNDNFDVVISQAGLFEINLRNPGLKKWDEYNPNLYGLKAEFLNSHKDKIAVGEESFGLRTIRRTGKRMFINGERLFMRGSLNGGEFPLTGYPPTETEAWARIFRTCKSYGINSFRFHSWCPPEAAFEAADQIGFYLHPEAPFWSTVYRDDPEAAFMRDELISMLDCYGDHPSMISVGVGNEIQGDPDFLNNLLIELKEKDPSRLYTADMNIPGYGKRQTPLYFDDFFVTRHTKKGSLRLLGQGRFEKNTSNDGTNYDLWDKVKFIDMPVINHELGQWVVHPAFDDLDRYQGNLKPYNLEMLRRNLILRGLGPKLKDFSSASGHFSWIFYKEDIENCFRTEDLGGFQLLQLHDFPGQGEALVGLLDAFYNSKGILTPEETREFCGDVVPLLRTNKFLWTNNETFSAKIEVANYSFKNIQAPILWQIRGENEQPYASGSLDGNCLKGEINKLGSIEYSLRGLKNAEQLTVILSVQGTNYKNQWNIWVYPKETPKVETISDLVISSHWDEVTRNALKAGKKVLLLIDPKTDVDQYQNILRQNFFPVYWTFSWNSSKHNSSSGLFCDPEHPALREFPTRFHSNFQWAQLQNQSLAFVLNGTPSSYEPIVYCIDDFHRGFKLGHILETKAYNGKLLICGFDLVNDLDNRIAARQLRTSILKYAASDSFDPKVNIDVEWLFHERIMKSAKIHAVGGDLLTGTNRKQELTFQEEFENWRTHSDAKNIIDNLFDNNWATGWEISAKAKNVRIVVELKNEQLLEGILFKPADRLKVPDEIKLYLGTMPDDLSKPVMTHQIGRKSQYLRQILFDQPIKGKTLVFEIISKNDQNISLAEIEPLFIWDPKSVPLR